MSDSKAFKDYYDWQLAHRLADDLEPNAHGKRPSKKFSRQKFLDVLHQGNLESLEMKGRLHLIAAALRRSLPPSYGEAVLHLTAAFGPPCPTATGIMEHGFHLWPYGTFIEKYGPEAGEESLDLTMQAVYQLTQRLTGEFAIRPMLLRFPERVFEYLESWVDDASLHVRRLVSEGLRPRLPWGLRLVEIGKAPTRSLKLLEKLRHDPSAYVRKSVANHLNDISKEHKDLALDVAARWWQEGHPHTRWIVKHALRNELKAGNPRALSLLGFAQSRRLIVQNIRLSKKNVPLGDSVTLTLALKNSGPCCAVMVDYAVHFLRKNGTSRKVFKWKVISLERNEQTVLEKQHRFAQTTTRQLYPGAHRLEILINGVPAGEAQVCLKAKKPMLP